MKYFCSSLSLIAITVYFGFVESDSSLENANPSTTASLSSTQKAQIYSKIAECNDTVPLEVGMKFFQPNSELIPANKSANCFIECVLRKMDVIVDNVIHVDQYLKIVKKLLLNYTDKSSADEWEKSTNNSAAKSLDVNYDHIKVYELATSQCQANWRQEDSCEPTIRFIQCLLENGRKEYPNMVIFPLSPPSDASLAKSRNKREGKRQIRLILRYG